MNGAAKSNVLMFLAAMCAVGTVWLTVSALGERSVLFAVMAALLAVATVVSFRTYRAVLRELDEAERRQT